MSGLRSASEVPGDVISRILERVWIVVDRDHGDAPS